MNKIRVYITDSHVLVRQMMVNILRTMQDVSPQGATSGTDEEGIFYTLQNDPPDLLLMGIHEEDSLEMDLLHHIRSAWPSLPIIVITPKSTEGGRIALTALRLGAVEFITTPDRKVNIPNARVHFLKRVVPAIRMAPRLNLQTLTQSERYNEPIIRSSFDRIRLAMVGGDTGGVHSLLKLVSALPSSIPFPILILQHVPAPYTRELSDRIARQTDLPVQILGEHELLTENQLYLVPGGFHATIVKRAERIETELHRGPREHRCRPSLDVLLRSAARSLRHQAMAIILSGGGNDGLDGARTIRQMGGTLLAESQESALLWDLPSRVIRNGWADGIYPASILGREAFRKSALLTDQSVAFDD
jgi:two-component system, chemotaxis family, protein-glutamate methylesterase/glutaminase